MSKHTVLITGGGSGIGLAFAERFLKAGYTVVVCGRSEARLAEARAKVPGLHTHVADVSTPEERVALAEWATREFPDLDTVVNNAGMMVFPDFTRSPDFATWHAEIALNLEAPIHLTALFTPHLAKQADPAMMFVSSGLAFVPLAATPVYSATKAAIHSFALSMRHQLRSTPIRVVEIAPPHVQTDLGTGDNAAGMPLDEYADAAMAQVFEGKLEVTVGFAAHASQANRTEQATLFARVNPA